MPVQFEGKPSLSCSAKMPNNQAVDIIDTPTLPKAPINPDGNIMLFFTVCSNWLKSIVNKGLTQKGFNIHLKILNTRLEAVIENIRTLSSYSESQTADIQDFNAAITYFRDDLKQIRERGYNDTNAREEINTLRDELSSLEEEVQALQSKQVIARKHHPAFMRALAKAQRAAITGKEGQEQNQNASALPSPTAAPMINQFLQQPSINYAALAGANVAANNVQTLLQQAAPLVTPIPRPTIAPKAIRG